jgi:CheY-like chemotaxis protein
MLTSQTDNLVFAQEKAGLQVLVVEDNVDTAQSMALLLEMSGYKVQLAADGPSALEEAQHNPPDVVLLDIGLPEMSGYEVAERLTAQGGEKRPLLIAITGFGLEADRRASARAGIDLHLVKPVDPVTLERVLNRFRTLLSE